MSPPSWNSLHLPSHPTTLDCYRDPVLVSWFIQQIPIDYLFYIWYCEFPYYSLYTSHPLLLPSPRFHKSVLYISLSIQFSHLVMSNALQPHGLQHTRLPCPSSAPRASANSCPSSQWCHPTISSSVIPFSSCLQSFPASGAFLMSQYFASSDQSPGVSVSASVLPMTDICQQSNVSAFQYAV